MRRVSIIFLAVGAWAQHAHHAAPPNEKPVVLHAGLGVWTHTIATRNPEAQKFFDQGLNLLYGFNRYEALRSFRKAAELDPAAPMPLWGIAMALGPHINMDMDGDMNLKEGCETLAKANRLALTASEYERGYLESAASRCPEYKPGEYSNSMRQIYERNPDDADAAVLYAESLMIPVRWKWWNADGTPNGRMDEAVRVLEQVMRRVPNHPGANHFYIHAVEMSPSPERAVPSAQRLMGIMPAAGHMVHMPGHIWLILGDWETAANVNERAGQVDREYFANTGVQSGYIGYYLHNLHFVAYARSMQGRAMDAIRAADFMVKEAAPAVESMPEMIDAFLAWPLFMRVRFHKWDELLAMPKPMEKLQATTALWHWARALAYAGKGDRAAAQEEAARFRAAREQVPAAWPWLVNKAVDALAVADAMLEARLAGTGAESVPHWRRAVELQDKLSYDEPPAWFLPLRESLGAALLHAGQAAEAEAVLREGMRRTPRNGRMLFGLMQSLEAQGKKEAAAMVRREFEAAWKRADTVASEAGL